MTVDERSFRFHLKIEKLMELDGTSVGGLFIESYHNVMIFLGISNSYFRRDFVV
jgi:hypothetical protein